MSKPDWAAIRHEFPTLETWTYLDTARKAPLPRCVEAATREFFDDVNVNAGDDVWSPEAVESSRVVMARVLGAPVESIAFVKNTTEGLNIASHALDLAPGDNIVITDESIQTVINRYTREAGVRNLERELSAICRKVARKVVVDGPETFETITSDKVT